MGSAVTSSLRCFLEASMRLRVAGLLIFSILRFFFWFASLRSLATRLLSFSVCAPVQRQSRLTTAFKAQTTQPSQPSHRDYDCDYMGLCTICPKVKFPEMTLGITWKCPCLACAYRRHTSIRSMLSEFITLVLHRAAGLARGNPEGWV